MPSDKADYSVEIVTDSGQADATVVVVDGISNLSPVAGDSLFFDGTNWVDRPLADGDIPAAIARDSEVAASYSHAGSVATFAARKTKTASTAPASATWIDFDTALDLVLTAKAGDWVEVGVSGLWLTEAPQAFLDVGSVVGAAIANTWGLDGPETATSNGVLAWFGPASVLAGVGSSIMRKLVAGDISAGTVTLRLRVRCNSASTKTMLGTADFPFVFFARNHG